MRIKHGEARVDALRPAVFDPADFAVIDYFDLDEWKDGGFAGFIREWREEIIAYVGKERFENAVWLETCDHCGTRPLRYIGIVRQESTGANFIFGSTCVSKAELEDRAELKLVKLKKLAANRRERARLAEEAAYFLNLNEDIRVFLGGIKRGEKGAPEDDFEFVNDMDLALNRWGGLTERQAAGLRKVIAKRDEPRKPEVVKGPAPEGRQTITGEVVSFKLKEGFYGWEEKIVIRLENNSGVWVTCPKSLHSTFKWNADIDFGDWLKGQTVELTATFTRADDDESFAFGKRPTGAKIVSSDSAGLNDEEKEEG